MISFFFARGQKEYISPITIFVCSKDNTLGEGNIIVLGSRKSNKISWWISTGTMNEKNKIKCDRWTDVKFYQKLPLQS
jgi:hypothetical protein